MRKFPLAMRIAEVEREIALRKNVYPGLVGRGRMKQKDVDNHLAIMGDVLDTLFWLKKHESRIEEMLTDGASKDVVVARADAEVSRR